MLQVKGEVGIPHTAEFTELMRTKASHVTLHEVERVSNSMNFIHIGT